jgi:hypothetical protein
VTDDAISGSPSVAAPPGADAPEPRVIAEFSDHNGLVEAFRRRALERKVVLTSETNNALAGLCDKFLAKLIGSKPVRNIGPASLGPLCGLLAVRCVMLEDPEAEKRLQMLAQNYGKVVEIHDGSRMQSAAWHVTLTRRFLQAIGRRGGKARLKWPAQKRRQAARKAALARWGKAPAAAVKAANPDMPRTLGSEFDEASIRKLMAPPRRYGADGQ